MGLSGGSALVQWLLDNDARSLYWGGSGNGLILAPFTTNYTQCLQKPSMSQYMNLTLYNTISAEAVCLAEGVLGTPYCTGL